MSIVGFGIPDDIFRVATGFDCEGTPGENGFSSIFGSGFSEFLSGEVEVATAAEFSWISFTKLNGNTPSFPDSVIPVHHLIIRNYFCGKYPSSSFATISKTIPFFKLSSSGCCAT